MPPHDRRVGSLRCSEVLERLSAYLDGELPDRELARVQEHVSGCDWCERFGSRFAGVVGALRRELRRAAPVPPDVAARLDARIQSL